MANGNRKAVVLSIEQRIHADPTMEKVAGQHGILCVKIMDWKMKRRESVILQHELGIAVSPVSVKCSAHPTPFTRNLFSP